MTSIAELRRLRRDFRTKMSPLAEGESAVLHWMKEARGPARSRPAGWNRWPAVEEAHRRLFMEHVRAIPVAPDAFSGRGIVTLAGGSKYFLCGFVMVSLLRNLGCQLPVEWWYLSPHEMDPAMIRLAESLPHVKCVCAAEVLLPRPRRMGGWECKVWAIMHSRFKEVLFLDADQLPAIDPTYLFDDATYREAGAVFWPDIPNHLGLDITEQAFRTVGLPPPGRLRLPGHDKPSDYRPFETGQILLDKVRHWKALVACRHLNEHSDYWYPRPNGKHSWLIYGDKSTFLLAWEATRTPYAMPRDTYWGGENGNGAFMQHDFAGNVVFQHKCQPPGKMQLRGPNRHAPGVRHQAVVDAIIQKLGERWNGRPWIHADQTTDEQAIDARALGRWSQFGLELPPIIELAGDGRIAGRVEHWTTRRENGQNRLIISDDDTAVAILGDDGQGNWIDHEHGVFLAPAPPVTFELPHGQMEAGMWLEIVKNNEYRLPDRFSADDVIVDVGAHVGTFAVECLRRGAGVVICVEPSRDNVAMLERNTSLYGPRVKVLQAAAWRSDEPSQWLNLSRMPGADHTAGYSVVGVTDGACVWSVKMDDILASVGRRIRLLKLDCEGAEFPILLTSRRLDVVHEICGEWHTAWLRPAPNHARVDERSIYSVDDLVQCLTLAGFDVVTDTHPDSCHLGHFWARRQRGAGARPQ